MYPELFNQLKEKLERLPGVGKKTAERYAFAILGMDEEDVKDFSDILSRIKSDIKPCPRCGFLSEKHMCPICDDDTRDHSIIMVVSYAQDVVAIEKTNTYHGMYHVLNGVISSSKGIYPDDLNIDTLLKRLDGVKEGIIATSPTIDGETTALYLDKLLSSKNIYSTRLAHGLPMGASLDYADEMTLIKAMENRRHQGE